MANTLYAAALAASLVLPTVNAGLVSHHLKARNTPTILPPCSTGFTDYIYAGCYTDPVPSGYTRALSVDTGHGFGSMTVDKCAAVCKSSGYRYAGLEYYGQCFCGNSVSGSLTTADHCTYPCNGNSSENCGGSYAMSVYQDPTYPFIPTTDISVISDYENQGCYVDSTTARAISHFQDQLMLGTMTTETCLQACKSQNYPIAGLEYGQECYCGVVLANGTAKAPDSDCNMKCNGWCAECDTMDYQYCGGDNRLNVWIASDVQSQKPCAAPVPVPVPSSSSFVPSAAPSSSTLSYSYVWTNSSTTSSTIPSSSPSPAVSSSSGISSNSSSTSSISTLPPSTSAVSTSSNTTSSLPVTTVAFTETTVVPVTYSITSSSISASSPSSSVISTSSNMTSSLSTTTVTSTQTTVVAATYNSTSISSVVPTTVITFTTTSSL